MYAKIREKRNALFFGSLLQMRNMHLTWIMEVRCIDERRLKRNEWARKRGENMIEKRWNAIARTIFGRARNWCACRASSLGSSVIVALLSQGNARGRWSCAARPHNSRGTSVYRHRSRASFRYVCRSLSFHVFVISILTLLPSHFFRAITCSVSLFTRCKSKERKKRRKRDIKRKFHKREFFHPFANN